MRKLIILLAICLLPLVAAAQTSTTSSGATNIRITNGNDVATGATTDAGVTGNTAGTLSAKVRGINQIFASVWDNVNSRINVYFQNTTLAVTGPLTDAQLRASAVPISGTVTANAGTGSFTVAQATAANLNATVTDGAGALNTIVDSSALPAGAATLAEQQTQTTALNTANATSAAHAAVAPANAQALGGYAEADAAALDSTNVVEGDISRLKATLEGRLMVDTMHPRRVNCVITSTAVASTLITGCAAPGAGLSIYVTDISYNSSIISTTANFMTLQSGTGGACGTTTTVVYRQANSVAFLPVTDHLTTPIKLTANHELCFLHPGAGTRLVNVQGFIAP